MLRLQLTQNQVIHLQYIPFFNLFLILFFVLIVQCPLCLQFFRSVRGVQTHMARSAVCNQDRRNIFTVDHQLALNPNLGQALIPVPRRRRSPTQQQVENVSVNIFEILFMSCSWAAFLAEKIFLCIACVFFFILILSNSSFLTFDDTLASKAASFLEEFQPNPIGTALSTVGWIFTFLIDKIFQQIIYRYVHFY